LPAIEILASSIFSQSFIVFVVAGILLTMYLRVRDIHLLHWAISWLSYSLYLAIGGIGFLSKVGGWNLNIYVTQLTVIALFFGYNSVFFLFIGAKALLYKSSIATNTTLIFQTSLIAILFCYSFFLERFSNDDIFFSFTFAIRSLITGVVFSYIGWKIFTLKNKYTGAKIFSLCLMFYAATIQFYTIQGTLIFFDSALPGILIGMLGIIDFTIQTIVVFSLVSWVLQKEHQQVLISQKRLQELAWEDSLTGLPNRLWLTQKSAPLLKILQENENSAALLFIDLDGFKLVNDTHGHASGDKLLKLVAQIIKDNLHNDDLACRLGGDEFILLIVDDNDRDTVINTANRIREQLEAIDIMSGHKVDISCSQGIAWFPDHAVDLETLIQLSDHAMYQAKKLGKAQLVEVSNFK